jgi:hypothetical protein
VSLIWRQNLIAENRLDLDRKTDCRWPDRHAESKSFRTHERDGVLGQVKAKPLRGGPAGRP